MGCTDMSEAGIYVKNDNNELLLNATYNNLYLFRKIKLTDLPYEELSRTGTLAFATPIQENEVIAAIARTGGGALQAFSVRMVQWIIYAPRTGQSSTSALLADLDDVYVYIFGINTSTETQAHGYGLQVFDENGVCVYNSNNKPMRVLHYANNISDSDTADAILDGYIVPSNKVCAIYNCAIARIATAGGQSSPTFFLNAYISNSGEVRQQNTPFGFAPFSFVFGDYIGYMVVDVTGY